MERSQTCDASACLHKQEEEEEEEEEEEKEERSCPACGMCSDLLGLQWLLGARRPLPARRSAAAAPPLTAPLAGQVPTARGH